MGVGPRGRFGVKVSPSALYILREFHSRPYVERVEIHICILESPRGFSGSVLHPQTHNKRETNTGERERRV